MEKPISDNRDGIDELEKEVIDRDLVFFMANNFRFHPVFKKIKEFIVKGELGRILFARIQAGQYLPDWHPWEDYRRGYSARRDLGGGVVLTLQHEIDYAYWLFGKFKHIKSHVKKISDMEIDVEDIASIIIETEEGSVLEVHLDYLQRPAKRTIQIQGTKGSLDYRIGDRYLKFYNFENQAEETILDIDDYDSNEMYIEEMKYFIRCISGEKNTISGISDGIYVLNACLKIKDGFNI
jgi:predicted dehydrogenase